MLVIVYYVVQNTPYSAAVYVTYTYSAIIPYTTGAYVYRGDRRGGQTLLQVQLNFWLAIAYS